MTFRSVQLTKTERKLTNTVSSRLMRDLSEKKRHNTTIVPLYLHTCMHTEWKEQCVTKKAMNRPQRWETLGWMFPAVPLSEWVTC